MSPALLRHVKARGNAACIFIANDDEDFADIKDHFGDTLDGIMTDYPSNLAKWRSNYQQPDTRAMLPIN